MKLSIRAKFFMVMSGLLLVCLGFYLLMSITVFKSDKTQLVYDLNRSQVSNMASELRTTLSSVADSLELFAQLRGSQQSALMQKLLSGQSEIVATAVYKNGFFEKQQQFINQEYFETYGLEKNQFFQGKRLDNVPIDRVIENGQAIWNASQDNQPPLIGFAKRVMVLDKNDVPVERWVLVSFLKLDSLLKSVSLQKLSDIAIANNQGEVLFQSDFHTLSSKPSVKSSAFFQKAISSPAGLSVSPVEESGETFLAAYARSFDNQVIVMAKAPEQKVFQVVQALTIRTLLFGSIVLTLVILAAFLMSRSLTENIALLAKRMSLVSDGDLSTQITLRGRDETVELGDSFNKMIIDLRKSREDLEEMNRELDQKVKDRTKQLEIQNRKVVEAQEAMIRTTRLASMGEVAGRAAHEVLNPLTSLLTRAGLTQKRVSDGYQQPLQLLDEIGDAWDEDYKEGGFKNLVDNWQQPSSLNPEQNLFVEDLSNLQAIRKNLKDQIGELQKDIQFIREEGDRIGKIIHGMRRLGNMKSDVRKQSIHQLLSDSRHIMADLFEQQGFEIRIDMQAEVDSVTIDRDEFIQSITNMMRNSLQSLTESRNSRQERGWVSLKTRNERDKILIAIEDNGGGISEQNQTKLFEQQFTTKSSDEGTGLGLSICRRFIRNYDGEIYFRSSTPDKSTLFEIELPLIKQNQTKAVA